MGVVESERIAKPQAQCDLDCYAWCMEQAARARAGLPLDAEHVAEEIESMGRSDTREIVARLEVPLRHLLTWHFQPELRGRNGVLTIETQRRAIASLIDESPSLAGLPAEALPLAFKRARDAAAVETGLLADAFPEVCPDSVEGALGRPLADWCGV